MASLCILHIKFMCYLSLLCFLSHVVLKIWAGQISSQLGISLILSQAMPLFHNFVVRG